MRRTKEIHPLLLVAALGACLLLGSTVSLPVLAQEAADQDDLGAEEEIGAEDPFPPGIIPDEFDEDDADLDAEDEAEDPDVAEGEEEVGVREQVAPAPRPRTLRPRTPRPQIPRARIPAARGRNGNGTAKITVQGDLVNLDFANADIQDVVKQISEITGKNFILDERVRGKITIISPTKVSIEEAYRVFLSVLQVKGFTTIQVGDFIKIIPLREAKESYTSILSGGTLVPQRDEYITRLIPLRYVDATDIANSLKPLVSRDASMIPYGPTNTIILSDTAYNINKVLDIIRQVDISSYQEVLEIIQIRFASAQELAAELQEVFGSQARGRAATPRRGRVRGAAAQRSTPGQNDPRIIVDERTNSLIILASPRQIEDIRNLIRRLDYETERGRIHVYYLENADAEELAETLGRLGVGEGRGQRGAGPRPRGGPAGAPAAVVATVAQLGEDVKITHDAPTNALIIEAPPEAYDTLRQVIEKLDIKRPQVLVEALILEVSVGPNSLSTGVTLAGGNVFNRGSGGEGGIFGSTAPSTGGTLLSAIDLNEIFTAAGAGSGALSLLNFAKTVRVRGAGPDGRVGTDDDTFAELPVIQAAIQAAAARQDVNILIAPNILTIDNEEAFITVGENIPIQTQSFTDVDAIPGQVSQSFERQDVGVTLTVTPQISEGNQVRLEIRNEITEVTDASVIGLPTLSNREVRNTVYVADGATVVIGGIIRTTLNKASNRVPWLGDIPGIGWAFKNRSKTLRKTNLILFITPHIVRSPDDLRKLTNYQQREFEEESREALKKPEKEARLEREREAAAAKEGKSLEEYEEAYNLDRARGPLDQALKDIRRKNIKEGEDISDLAPKATPGRREEIIGGPAPEAKAPDDTDATAKVLESSAEGEGGGEPEKLAAVAPEPAPEPSAPPPAGPYTVQVAAFSDSDEAEELVDKLRAERYDVFLTSAVTESGSVVHRVSVGRFKSDEDASRIASRLAKDYRDDGAVPFVVKLTE